MDIYSLSAVVVLLVAVVFAIVQNRKKSEQIKQFEERFAEVLDVDKEVESVTAQKVEVEGALTGNIVHKIKGAEQLVQRCCLSGHAPPVQGEYHRCVGVVAVGLHGDPVPARIGYGETFGQAVQ